MDGQYRSNNLLLIEILTLNKYSTALSGLLKLARIALRTCSCSKPIAIMFVTASSYSCPVTRALSALQALMSDAEAVVSEACVRRDSETEGSLLASVEL